MRPNAKYGSSFQPEFDPLFCLLATALELQCEGKPCDTCKVRPMCLKWWDSLCSDSVEKPLEPDDYDTAKNRIRFMSLFK